MSLPGVSPPADVFPPGAVFVDRYRIVSPVGKGGMGVVYRAEDLKLGHPIALKFIPHALTDEWIR